MNYTHTFHEHSFISYCVLGTLAAGDREKEISCRLAGGRGGGSGEQNHQEASVVCAFAEELRLGGKEVRSHRRLPRGALLVPCEAAVPASP